MSSSTNAKPAIVLAPGCWHAPLHYQDLVDHLQNAGYPTEVASLPSLNPTDGSQSTLEADINAVRERLLAHVDQGRNVILMGHSYGGCPGGAAAKGLSRAERAPNAGAVIGLVWFAGYLVQETHSVVQTVGEMAPWLTDEGQGRLGVKGPIDVFYNDVPAEKASWAASQLQFHALAPLTNPSPAPAWKDTGFDGRRGYIYCLKDQCMPLSFQQRMVRDTGVEWTIREMEASHSPHLSKPQELTDHIIDLISSFDARS